jgi:hypothetical protein
MDDLCQHWGFCIPEAEVQRLSNVSRITADQFAGAFLAANGLSPSDSEWFPQIRRLFIERLGLVADCRHWDGSTGVSKDE